MSTQQQIKQDQIIFILNEKEKTASVIGNEKATGQIYIPRSIFHQNQEFIITSIKESSFKNNLNISAIRFPPDSEIQIIEKYSFALSSIEGIFIPRRVKTIGEGAFMLCHKLQFVEIPEDSELQTIEKSAFSSTLISSITIPDTFCEFKSGWSTRASRLSRVKIMPNNQRYKNYGDDLIIGKSDIKSDNFDVLIFANRNIKAITIPPFIKIIASDSFAESIIESISIPSQVLRIDDSAFFCCKKLQKIEFEPDSQLQSIGNNVFFSCSLTSLSIPSSVCELAEEWCAGKLRLNRVNVMPNNKRYKNHGDDLVIGKSDIKSDNFDVLVFASRNIKTVTIPSFIKFISPHAFDQSSLKKVVISSHVVKIGKYAFHNCNKLQCVEFSGDSKLRIIDSLSFSGASIEAISLPKKVEQICDNAFYGCRKLRRIDIPQNSELKIIGKHAFANSKIDSIYIPRHVFRIEDFALHNMGLRMIEIDENAHLDLNCKKVFSPYNHNIIINSKPIGMK